MDRKKWAPALAGVIGAVLLFGVVAAAVHQDTGAKVATRPPATSDVRAGGPADRSTPTTDTPETTTTSAPAASGTTAPSTTAKPGTATTTTPSTRPGAPATSTAPTTGSGPAPTRPGTYTYTQTGSSTSTGSLVIAPPTGGRETWVRSGGSFTSTTVVLFNASGMFTESLTAFGATCTFAPQPLPLPPWPVTVGSQTSGTATCSAPINAQIVVAVKVVGAEGVVIGGATISAFVVTTGISVSGITLTQTDWYAPSLRLPVRSHLVVTGFLALDETATLVSTTPT